MALGRVVEGLPGQGSQAGGVLLEAQPQAQARALLGHAAQAGGQQGLHLVLKDGFEQAGAHVGQAGGGAGVVRHTEVAAHPTHQARPAEPGHCVRREGQVEDDAVLAGRRFHHEGAVALAGAGDEEVEVAVVGDGHGVLLQPISLSLLRRPQRRVALDQALSLGQPVIYAR